MWRHYLKICFISRGRRLRSHLGVWKKIDLSWPWYFCSQTRDLYRLQNQQWKNFALINDRTVRPIFSFNSHGSSQPLTPHRATVHRDDRGWICSGFGPIASSSPVRNYDFNRFLDTIPPSMSWCVENLKIVGEWKSVEAAIRDNCATIVSDGSFTKSFSTAAFILESHNVQISNQVIAPGRSQDMSAYRSELAGIYAAVFLICSLCDFFQIESGTVTFGCDGLSALNQAFATYTPPSVSCPSYDLIMAIHQMRKATPVSWKPSHVEGHQDDHTPFDSLDRMSQLNVEADHLAKLHQQQATSHPRHFTMKGEPWSIHHKGCKLLDFPAEIYSIIHSKAARSYWNSTEKIQIDCFDYVNWEAIEVAMKGTDRTSRIFIAKHTMGMCGVGKWMKRWKERDSAACPRCGMTEDATHVLCCHGSGADQVWSKAIDELSDWFKEVHTAPEIASSLLEGFNFWRRGLQPGLPSDTSTRLACEQQMAIGWHLALEGWLSTEWEVLQQEHYSATHSRRSGRHWASNLVKKVWRMAWSLWEHRNCILHEQENNVTSKEIELLHRNITRLYGRLDQLQLGEEDQWLSSIPFQALLKKSRDYKVGWVRAAKTVIKNKKRVMRNSLRQTRHMRMVMRQWLQTRHQ